MASRDYEEFIAALNHRGVRYLIIGAHAVALHARPRATKDLDILLDPSRANARRVLTALQDFFRGADAGYTAADLMDPRWIIQIGIAPVRIDLISHLPGSRGFRSLWRNRIRSRFGRVRAYYLGLEDLIRAKEATGRGQDRVDARLLRLARGGGQQSKHPSRRSRRS